MSLATPPLYLYSNIFSQLILSSKNHKILKNQKKNSFNQDFQIAHDRLTRHFLVPKACASRFSWKYLKIPTVEFFWQRLSLNGQFHFRKSLFSISYQHCEYFFVVIRTSYGFSCKNLQLTVFKRTNGSNWSHSWLVHTHSYTLHTFSGSIFLKRNQVNQNRRGCVTFIIDVAQGRNFLRNVFLYQSFEDFEEHIPFHYILFCICR